MASFNFETHNIKITSLPGDPSQDGTDATGVVLPTGATGIRGWLSGIYNLFNGGTAKVNATLTGSNLPLVASSAEIGKVDISLLDYEIRKISAKTANPFNFKFSQPVKVVNLTNFGSDVALCSLNGYPAIPIIHDNLDATKWTFTGTWSNETTHFYYGTNSQFSSINGNNAVYNPGTDVRMIGISFVPSSSSGIAKIELSLDGTTWQNPSDIAGVLRTDGATGTSMNTFDLYYNTHETTTKTTTLSFIVPSGAWKIKVTVTNIKNTLSSNYRVYIDAGMIGDDTKSFELKPGETKYIPIVATSVSVGCSSGAPEVIVEGYR